MGMEAGATAEYRGFTAIRLRRADVAATVLAGASELAKYDSEE